MTIEQLYKEYADQLKNIYDEREAASIADWAFENITNISRIERTLNKEKQLSSAIAGQLHNALEQLLKYRPIQYVLGEAWFYKMKLFVNEHVLIPRPETEELVEWIVEDIQSMMYDIRGIKATLSPITNRTLDIVDIGTGSGCIAIALKKALANANVSGIDVSAEALSVAKRNADEQNANIDLLQVDFLDEKSKDDLPTFNIIVSNPPYIPENEKNILDKNVVAHEPHSALFVSDDDPFIFYKQIAKFGLKHLSTDGKIYVELHERYANEVKAIFSQYHFTSIIKKDIYGRERMICAQR